MTAEIVEALLRRTGRLGQVLSMVRAYEQTDVGAFEGAPVSSAEMARAYLSALGWTRRTMDGALGSRRMRG